MSDNRKYYYLKLKENYFDEDAIVLLESMQDGILYSNILLKLYLKSLKNGGKLQLDENIPYTAQMIATITRQQVGTVERALQIFMKLGLVEPLQNGALYMSNIELLIGQSSTEGERKRRARLALQEQKALPKAGADKCPPYQADICPPEIEIEKEIEKERERELDTGQPARAAYGRYENVFLSQSELDGLKADLPGKWDYYIDRLSCHIASSGKRYKSHAATIYKWAQEDATKKAPKKGSIHKKARYALATACIHAMSKRIPKPSIMYDQPFVMSQAKPKHSSRRGLAKNQNIFFNLFFNFSFFICT